MAKILNKNNIMKAVAEGQLGFSFADPERIDEHALSAVLPILRKTTTKRQYITYPETEQLIVTDSGSINKMTVENTTDENIFLRNGTIFAGKTQERALVRSTVVFPHQKLSLEVRCVHASKGINGGAEAKYGGITPLDMDMRTYTDGFRATNQQEYWNSVQCYTSSINGGSLTGDVCLDEIDLSQSSADPAYTIRDSSVRDDFFGQVRGANEQPPPQTYQWFSAAGFNRGGVNVGGSDDLASTMNDFAKNFDDILSRIKCHENQVGFGLIDTEGCQTIELFDVEKSWAALHNDAVCRVGDKLGDQEPQPFEYKAEKAIENVKWVLSREYKMNTIFRHKPTDGEPDLEITGLTHEKFVGEIVELDGKVIHLVIIRKLK